MVVWKGGYERLITLKDMKESKPVDVVVFPRLRTSTTRRRLDGGYPTR